LSREGREVDEGNLQPSFTKLYDEMACYRGSYKFLRFRKQEDWQDTYGSGWTKFKKMRAIKNDNRAFGFDVVMANPPFAGDIKQTDMLCLVSEVELDQ
jgi:hypothetical protein